MVLRFRWEFVGMCTSGKVLTKIVESEAPTFRGQGGLGQVEETQSLVEATHLLDQVGDSWQESEDGKKGDLTFPRNNNNNWAMISWDKKASFIPQPPKHTQPRLHSSRRRASVSLSPTHPLHG